MTLEELTGHESGIVIYGDNSVGVCNWCDCGDNQFPLLSPLRLPMPWPEDYDVFDGAENSYCKDIRDELPGSIWIEHGEDGDVVATDMDVVYDWNCDLARLFLSKLDESEYEGYIFTLRDGRKVIVPTAWN